MKVLQKTLTPSAQCAKEIRKVLKEKYPAVKFSVRSKNFSMGDAVRVSWNLGPTDDEIENLIGHFQYGHFNGMEDIYEYSNTINNLPQTKFLTVGRTYKIEEEIEQEKINSKLGWNMNRPGYVDMWREGKTLYHQIGKDLCVIMDVLYNNLDQRLEEDFKINVPHFPYPTLRDLVNVVVRKPKFGKKGYQGARFQKSETDGRPIRNMFEIF